MAFAVELGGMRVVVVIQMAVLLPGFGKRRVCVRGLCDRFEEARSVAAEAYRQATTCGTRVGERSVA